MQGSPALAEAIEGAPKGGSGGGGGSPPDTDPPDPNAWARDITDPLAWAKENLQTEGKSVLELGVSVARTRALAIAAEAEGLDDLAFELRKEARAVVDEKKLLQLVPEGGMNGTVYASPLQKDKDLINSIFSIKDKKIVPSKDPKDPANMFPDRRTPTVSVTAKKDDKGKTNITSDKESSQTAANILKDLQEEKDNIIASSTTPSETAANISQLETALSASSQNPSGQISLKEGGLMQRKKKKGK